MKKRLLTAAAVICTVLAACSDNSQSEHKLKFNPGSYIENSNGMKPMELEVTFNSSAVTGINVISSNETPTIGQAAMPEIISRIISANGTGIDAVTGATVTTNGVKEAVNKAAVDAGVSNIEQFKSNRDVTAHRQDICDTWDIIVIGAGGAGLAAAAQAAQDGNTVLVIEKNAGIGGNTVTSGGLYQSVMPYLVWDSAQPDATEGTGLDGKKYAKCKSVNGCIETLRTILNWSESTFDESYYKSNEFVAGDIEELSKHGVHKEYLTTLQALKTEIRTYLAWAEPKLNQGIQESQLTLFSTDNLHIFQTYYGGLRPSNDNSEWCYGDAELVKQMVAESHNLKPWLMNMGVKFEESQTLIVGELWYRANRMPETTVQVNGQDKSFEGNEGAYVMAPYSAFINADSHNTLMTMTSARNLIVREGRVVGVNAVCSDSTKVTAYANKGVIIATGGYAANIAKVIETNRYWKEEYLTQSIKTTNRSTMQGDGIGMSQKVGADVTGMGWTQLMPLSYIDDGSLAFGGVDNSIFVSPVSGKRYIDESEERDVLCIAAFQNGIELRGAKGTYLYISGLHTYKDSYGPFAQDKRFRQYTTTVNQLSTVLSQIGISTNAQDVINTIKAYDKAVMAGTAPADAGKKYASAPIGKVELNSDGSYNTATYSLDDTQILLRILAPATHHTMGGLRVDTDRHVLDRDGKPVPGLYAAGEVTGGIHGGNRLGGNALTEILIAGRIAAKSAAKGN